MSYDDVGNLITKLQRIKGKFKVYNFEVMDNHDYLVGTHGVLVHNADYGDGVEMVNRGDLEPTQEIDKSKKEFRKLAENIKQNGILEPIEYYEKNGENLSVTVIIELRRLTN